MRLSEDGMVLLSKRSIFSMTSNLGMRKDEGVAALGCGVVDLETSWK